MTFGEVWSTVASALTLPAVVAFVALYAKPSERWWRSWFGWSLMLMAVAIGLSCLATVLFRIVGHPYPGRDVLLIVGSTVTLVAMVMRTGVLLRAQRRDRSAHPNGF